MRGRQGIQSRPRTCEDEGIGWTKASKEPQVKDCEQPPTAEKDKEVILP